MSNLEFRTLTADEIECRVQTVVYNESGTKGCSILLYKDARCDMNILDETVGPYQWQRIHSRDNANCTVMIKCPEFDEWISKEDTGTESNTEKEKGLASDSFKRACVNWGIGRELYTAPFIWIDGDLIEWKKDGKGKWVPKSTFSVDYIDYDFKRRITALAIKTNKGKVVWSMGQASEKSKKETKPKAAKKEEPKNATMECPICGAAVTARTDKKGYEWQPIDILKVYGGMCPECHQRMKDESKNN